MPDWLRQAKVRPYISPFGSAVDPLVAKIVFGTTSEITGKAIKINKEGLEKAKDNANKESNKALKKNEEEGVKEQQEDDQSEEIIEERYGKKKFGRKEKETGYTKKEIEKMDRLIEIVE